MVLWQFALAGWMHAADGVVYQGKAGPGQGKHIVFLAGDEEYRSEEGLPMLAKILAVRHGFKCTVLFAINPADGTIDPLTLTNMPGMAALDSADLCVMGLRFRELPDAQMKHFVDYLNAGKPIIALRTSTHAFKYDHNKASPYAKYDWHSNALAGRFRPAGARRDVGGSPRQPRQGEHARGDQRGVQGASGVAGRGGHLGARRMSMRSPICPRTPGCSYGARCCRA